MCSLLSQQQQQNQQESKRKRREKVRQGIKFILSHFKEPVFPRTISSINTAYYGAQFKVVYNEKEMLRVYEQSNFRECRVSIYPVLYATKEHHSDKDVDVQQADLIRFSLYKPVFMRESAQIKALYAILQSIKKILAGKPTILWSGDAFHIYQPIEPYPLEQIEEFRDHVIKQYPMLHLFHRFQEQKLSSNKLAPSHQQQSFDPSMLWVPGTFNSKCIQNNEDEDEKQDIKIIQRWDGHRPTTRIDLHLINVLHEAIIDPKISEGEDRIK